MVLVCAPPNATDATIAMNDLQETIAELVGEGAAIRVAVAALIRTSPQADQMADLFEMFDAQTVEVLKQVAAKNPDFGKIVMEAYTEVLSDLAAQMNSPE
jgi:hypothetical protein